MTQADLALEFDADIGPDIQAQVLDIVSGWSVPELAGHYRVCRMSGGGSNINLKLEDGVAPLALRVCAPEPERWGVIRAASIEAQSDASKADLAPPVFASRLPEGHFLSPFLPGGVLTPERMRAEGLLPAVVETLRGLHRLETAARDFSPFEDAALFVRLGNEENVSRPEEFAEMYARVQKIESLFQSIDAPRAFCHSDLVPQNFIVGDHLRLLDWDYAGNGWVAFEMASFACQAGLTGEESEQLLFLYDPCVDNGQRARVALMRAVAGVREAAWATMAEPILSGQTTPLAGWSYQGYAASNLQEARNVWSSTSFDALLDSARDVRPGALF